ncbi:MAG: TRAP transporter large permease [Firmicutes bacterium]|nr:TRAP transporter large permease [Bacillota bacterium]
MLGMTAIMFLVLILILFLGTPISLGIGFLGMSGILIFLSPDLLNQLSLITFSQTTSVTTLMIPLFVMMAEWLSNSGVAADMFDTIARRLHRLPGNLAIASVVASTIFSAVCGSAPATAATVGTISIPSMKKAGYDGKLAAGLQAAGGCLGILIPPSITFIMYGIITETSIAELFMAGIIPGVMMALLLIIYALVQLKLHPASNIVVTEEDKVRMEDKKAMLRHDIASIVPIMVLIIIVLGCLYTGIATATESAAIGAVGALILVIGRKRLTKACIKMTMLNTTKNSCMILFMMIGGLVFSFFLTAYGLPQELATTMLTISPNKWVTFAAVMVVMLILGCFLEPVGILMITMPFVFPTLTAMGFDPIWLGVECTIACMVGMITPPVGMNLFVLKGCVPGLDLATVIKGAIPMCILMLVSLIIIAVFPAIATFLPASM